MAWTVDTCVLLDVIENDRDFGMSSALCLQKHLPDGLVICPVSFVELGPAFDGNVSELRRFLHLCGVQYTLPFDSRDAETGNRLWSDWITAKRKGHMAKRPVADALIGAFALKTQGLITRNPKDFLLGIPGLKLLVPC